MMETEFWGTLNKELIKSTGLMSTILESMATGVFLVNLDGTITFWNRAAERITGYNRNEIIGKPCGQLPGEVCSDGSCDNGILSCGLFTSEEPIERECRILGKDGRYIYLMKSARVVKDRNGRPFMGIVNLVDITRVKEVDQKIQFLKNRVFSGKQLHRLRGNTPVMHKIFSDIMLASRSDANVLISGESGTGKELAAQAIHTLGARKPNPFMHVNCCSIPETLLESELFGHMKGSFTGAHKNKAGRFEMADGGTLFIDEVGELTPNLQVKLLRFLQSRTFERIGSSKSKKIDVRIVCATNRELYEDVREGKFREDLYYRINVFPVRMPSLRERTDDIGLLVEHFILKHSVTTGKPVGCISQDALDKLKAYHWPGNVRELENAIEHAFVRTSGDQIEVFDLPENILNSFMESAPMADRSGLTDEKIRKMLSKHGWHREQTAHALGISRITLWKKMKKFGIDEPVS
jgi:two-component system, NtrC family, response regulator HydG